MASRLDIVIFGATGFTGKYTIPYVLKFAQENGNLTWGVAGRSELKLKSILDEMGQKVSKDLSKTPIILADVSDENSLNAMASRARVIINACGPYRFFGEPVVKACVDNGTHHVDVSGEPQFIETIQLKYDALAKEKNIFIISACGLDSIPCDLGLIYLENKFPGTLNSVETYLEGSYDGDHKGALINYGTWQSAVHGLAHWDELRDLRRKLYAGKEKLPALKPKLNARGSAHKSEVTNKWSFPFLGSDRSVALRSQRFLYEQEKKRPVQLQCYFCMDSWMAMLKGMVFGLMFIILVKFKFGQKVLLDYPEFFSAGTFSKQNPPEHIIENTKFKITFVGKGWSSKLSNPLQLETEQKMDRQMITEVSGVNPGYGVTCAALALSALTILTERERLPKEGGVLSPGAAFAKTSIIDKLQQNGCNFKVISSKDV